MSRPADSKFPLDDDGKVAERSEVRNAVNRFLLIGLTALIIVAVPVALWVRAQAESHALTNAVSLTQRLADYTIGPLVTEPLLRGDPAALRLLDSRMEPWTNEGSIVWLKVWDAEGRIVYSDVPSLIGHHIAVPDWGPELLRGGPGKATLGLEDDPEYESGPGELVEVYVRALAATGEPLIFEAYYDDDAVREEQTALLLGMAPAFLLSLGALQLAQLAPAVRLARRIQAHQATRRRLLQHAVDASDLERQRIARDLHDEVIQDLAGLSYALEAEEMHGSAAQRPLFGQARSILQSNVRALRAMTTELYPPDLDQLGLPEALRQLAGPLRAQGVEVKIHVPESCELDRACSAMFYRVAREVLANTFKHARASTLELSLFEDRERTILLVRDDGCGFDPSATAPDGHVGLKIMRGTIHVSGGSLEVRSWPGGGTSVTVVLDRASLGLPRGRS